MLVRILKSNQAYNLFLFPLIGIVLWLFSLISPEIYQFAESEDHSILFKPVIDFLRQSNFLQVFISLFLVVLSGFLIQRLNSKYAFYRIRTLLPSNLIIIMVSGLSILHVLHPVYFAAIFFILAIDKTFGAFEKRIINSNAFDTGLLIGVGSLFYSNLIFFFPAFVIGMRILNREFNWRNFVLILWGFLLPWVFTFSYFYFFNKVDVLLSVLENHFTISNKRLPGNAPMQVYTAFWVFLLMVAGLFLVRNFDKMKISTRKYYSVFLIFIISCVLIFIFSPFVSVEIMVLLAIPSSYFVGNLLLSINSNFIGNLILFILLGLVIFMQLTETGIL